MFVQNNSKDFARDGSPPMLPMRSSFRTRRERTASVRCAFSREVRQVTSPARETL